MSDQINEFMDGQAPLSTKSAKIVLRRDGHVYPLIQCTKFKAKVEKKKETVQTLGSFMKKHKATSAEGTGSMGGYVIDSELLKTELGIIRSGQDSRFSAIPTLYGNENQGNQVVELDEVSLDDIPIADLESDDGLIEFESDFTFDDVHLVQAFSGKQ
ncbi:phage tail protein [Apilactobacillus micheneri]|uniref:phage tail tube protein n=1 Tax=Apilactobacillus micheneri TaxID=1899430 RepID=UPI00112C07A2|nr:phage tail tube protein [Apilactobacillus micheneri]TPR48178.1 phage tail protein [Apilactobacillus micheneri]